jgi:O-antigen/teichoic acid export membrane protein
MRLGTSARFALMSLFYSGAEVGARSFQFACLFVLARNCTKEQYGALGLVFAAQQLFTMLALAGLTEVMAGRSPEFRRSQALGTLFGRTHRLLVKKTMVLVLAAALLAGAVHFLGVTDISPLAMFCGCLSGTLLARSRLVGMMYQLEERHPTAIQFQTAPLLICYAVGLACACSWSDPVDGLFVGGCGGLMLWSLFTGRMPVASARTLSRDAQLERSLFLDSLHFAAIAFLGWLSGYGNSVVVQGMFSARDVADYTMTCNFDAIVFILLASVAKVWSPRFYKMAAEQSADRVNLANAIVYQGQAILVALAGGLVVILFPLVPRLIQGNFSQYSHLGPCIATAYAAHLVLNGYYRSNPYFLLHRKGPEFFRILFVTSMLGFVAWVVAMWLLGTAGIYLGLVLMAFFRSTGTYLYARRQWRLPSGLLDSIFALAILGIACALSATSLSIGVQLVSFGGLAGIALTCLYLGSMAGRLRELRREPAAVGVPLRTAHFPEARRAAGRVAALGTAQGTPDASIVTGG